MAQSDDLFVDFLRDNTYGIIDYNLENRNLASGNPKKNWIFPDKPRLDLSINSYPRVSVTNISESGELQGIADTAHYWQNIRLQIDIFAKKDLICRFFKGRTTTTVNTSTPYQNLGDITFRI